MSLSTEWIITLVSLILTTLMAISALITPYIMKIIENKYRTKEKTIDFLTQTIYEFLNSYSEFRCNSLHKMHVLSAIYKVMTFCQAPTKSKLNSLAELISMSTISYKDCDSLFFECITLLQQDFSLMHEYHK